MREKKAIHLPLNWSADGSKAAVAAASGDAKDTLNQHAFSTSGKLSEFVVRPEVFEDYTELQAPPPPVENEPLRDGIPNSRTYRRPPREIGRITTAENASWATGGLVGDNMDISGDHAGQHAEEEPSRPPTTREFGPADYAKGLEPKAMLPFHARPGQTPRKIEIERKKRLFYSQNIGELIYKAVEDLKQELAEAKAATLPPAPPGAPQPETLPDVTLSTFLSLENFDDQEYESRDIREWLDMETYGANDEASVLKKTRQPHTAHGGQAQQISASGTQYATIPVPGQAFNGTIWRDCLVMAYNWTTKLWKVRWKNVNGWTYSHVYEDEDENDPTPEDDEEEDEEEEALESADRTKSGPKSEAWVHRSVKRHSVEIRV
ncbi:Dynein heavy chain 1, axonemal [Geranomyces variabilis]|uniref:Dynein heavy chain 1, axonemal n=1 Tax=Geranomyces variabilis TaxID=109894 RepID=A0AAD5XTZ2_9FUNG|nr:Dynein heavy chain 1, axonemal [Geranomyces variabilis]